MQLYNPQNLYLTSILESNPNIFLTKNMIGYLTRLEGFIYFIPIDNLKKSDYNEDGSLKKSTPTIIRMIDQKSSHPIGKLLLSNMFPIPYKEVKALSLTNVANRDLYEKRIKYLKSNQKRIQKAIERLYKQKCRNYNQSYLKITLNFKELEKQCLDWELKTYGKHYNRFPDSQYFIQNPYDKGESEYYLMNKNIKIAKLIINNETQNIASILSIYNKEYAPLECFENNEITAHETTSWFKGRGIPSWREGLDELLTNSGIKTEILLLNKAFGLSLSDQYWMNPVEKEMNWNDINFFDHDFNSSDFIEATFENKIINKNQIDFYTPNNTSDGMLKKAWIVGKDKERYLLKGSYHQKGFEPFCEVLASMILEILSLNHVQYEIDYLNSTVVSKCKDFITPDTELISAYAIFNRYEVDLAHLNSKQVYHKYINILKQHNISHPEEKIAKMFICDYLIVNQDRHLGNFGIIRDVNNLKWLDVAPIYDSGQSMYSQKEVYEMNYTTASGSFFNEKDKDYDSILPIVLSSPIDIDYTSLYEVADKWKQLLYLHQDKVYITNNRIETCYQGLLTRINKLKKISQDINPDF